MSETIPTFDHGSRGPHRFSATMRTAAGAPYSIVTDHDGAGLFLVGPDGETAQIVPAVRWRARTLAEFQAVIDKHHHEAGLKIAAAKALADHQRSGKAT